MCTKYDFLSSKTRFIHTSILDRILALEKTTRMPRVHLVYTSNRAVKYPNLKNNNNTDIEHVFEFNFLGVNPQSVLLTLYNTLILPHFQYYLLLWGSSIKENHPLHLLQKKAMRIIDNSNYIAHTEPISKVHRLLKLPDMFSIALLKFYYKLMNNKLPKCFSNNKT